MSDQTRYTIVLQAADGRETEWRGSAPSENVASSRALRDTKNAKPVDSRGKASEWRVLHVR